MVEPIFTSVIFADYILPFVLVFTLVFAVLQKTKLLGDGKRQIDALIGLVVGLILIAFPFARNVIVLLMPFLAVAIVVLLVFMLLYGFIMGKKEVEMHKGLKIALGIIVGLGLITVLLFATGWWDVVYDFMFERETSSQIWVNALLIAVIAGAVIAVLSDKKGSGSSSETT